MKNKNIFIIIFIVILLILSALNINRDNNTFIENYIIDIFNYTNKILINNKIDSEIVNIDNEKQELKNEITELKSLLDIDNILLENDAINCVVINRNIGFWYNNLTIDKGLLDNIEVGDAVVTSDGLIGKIDETSNYFSKVKLFTNVSSMSKISVKININNSNNYVYGLFYDYDIDRNIYKIEGIDNIETINEGDIVSTSGLTDDFPEGIKIGYVYRVVMDEYDLNSIVEVKPSVNLNNISYVKVLKRKV